MSIDKVKNYFKEYNMESRILEFDESLTSFIPLVAVATAQLDSQLQNWNNTQIILNGLTSVRVGNHKKECLGALLL